MPEFHHEIYCVNVQIEANSSPQTFYFRRIENRTETFNSRSYEFGHKEFGVFQLRDGRPGPLEYGFVQNDSSKFISTQSGYFDTIQVKGQEYPILRDGTLTVWISYLRPKERLYLVRSGEFTYNPDTVGELSNYPELYLALTEGTKITIGQDEGKPNQEERGTFVPVGGKGPGDRERLVSREGYQVVLD